jgi:hypothetical protein
MNLLHFLVEKARFRTKARNKKPGMMAGLVLITVVAL